MGYIHDNDHADVAEKLYLELKTFEKEQAKEENVSLVQCDTEDSESFNQRVTQFAGLLNNDSLGRLYYLHAVITETLRLYPAVPQSDANCMTEEQLLWHLKIVLLWFDFYSLLEKLLKISAKTHAIFVPNLPMNATVEQLEAVFNNFGPIKHNANNDRGRFSGRAGYQNDNFRGRGNFSGGNFSRGRGYGRNDFERRGDFSNQTHGNAGRNEETVHRVYHYQNDNFRGCGNFSGGNFSRGRGYGRNDFERRGDFSNRTHGNAGRNEETVHRVYQNGVGKATRQASQGSMS
nr:cytochrome p450 [Quercus suber]